MTSLKHEFCSLNRLSYDIGVVYNGLTDLFPGLTDKRVSEMQYCVKEGRYTLSPLIISTFTDKSEIEKEQFVHIITSEDSDNCNEYHGIKPTEEDGLVLLALGRMLNLHFLDIDIFVKNSYGLKLPIPKYYDMVCKRGNNVLMFYKIDLTNSCWIISRESILCKLSDIVMDKKIIELVKKFLYSPIVDTSGQEYLTNIMIPSAELITSVLLNLALMEFDKEFQQVFPELEYSRYVHQVFVSITNAEIKQRMPLDIFEDKVRRLFDKLNVTGKILSIVPGEGPVRCYRGEVSVSQDGEIKVKYDV